MSPVSCLAPCMVLLLAGCATANGNWENKVDEEGRKVQSMQIQAPSMTEEDQYGYTMPEQYRCDSCKVVVHHLNEALTRRQPKNRRLQEWEYHELFDETCANSFSGYGVALVNGQNALSGPALKRDNLEAGMGAIQMGGETWSKRLGELCRRFVYEKIGEDEVYEHFRSHSKLSSDLCFHETRDCQLGPEAPRDVKKSKKASRETGKKSTAQNSAESKGQKKAKQAKTQVGASADIDLNTFMEKLAKKHGVTKAEYTKKRSVAQWEQFLSMTAQRISHHADKQASQVIDV